MSQYRGMTLLFDRIRIFFPFYRCLVSWLVCPDFQVGKVGLSEARIVWYITSGRTSPRELLREERLWKDQLNSA